MEKRYTRIEQVDMIGPEGLAALQGASVAVVGAGNIGGQVAQHLAMLGMGVLVVDKDTVAEENLGTQGFASDQLGSPKAEARARHLAQLNPSCRIEALHADIEQLGLGALRDMALIFSCLDSRRSRVVVNELATRLGIPWVDAAVDGSGRSLLGRVAAYDPRSPTSSCYLCPHDSESLGEVMREGGDGSCPTWRWEASKPVTAPTLAISALGAVVAGAQAIWGLKLLLGHAEEVVGREMYLDLGRSVVTTHEMNRNPRCVLDHQVFALTPFGRSASEITVEDAFAEAEARLGPGVSLRLHRRSIATELSCPECAAVSRPYRVLEATTPKEATCRCGTIMQPVALGLRDRLSKEDATEFLQKTWEQVGLPPSDVITASRGNEKVHLLLE